MSAARRIQRCLRAVTKCTGLVSQGYPRARTTSLAALVVAVLTAGLLSAAAMSGASAAGQAAAASASGPTGRNATGASAGTAGGHAATNAIQAIRRRPAAVAAPLRVLSISAGRRHRADGAGPIRVVFSAPLAPGSPLPRLRPAARGTWARAGRTLAFTPATPLRPATSVLLRVPAGWSGVRSAAGGRLASPVLARLRTHGWSTRSLEQFLARLRYLPLRWSTQGGAGRFSWRPGYPAALRSLWHHGRPGLILTGALMAFQADHGLPMDGLVTAAVRRAVYRAAKRGQADPHGYSYALASKAVPETLTVWHDGQVVIHSLANTGIAVSPTASGTFPVYLRYRFQVMRGINWNGQRYTDPVHYVSYFNGGDAVHSFYRASYGFPQSLGCVELPLAEAREVWPYLTYGSLVTVAG